MESHLHCSIQWGRQSAALSREACGARENTSSLVSMPSGAVETQWQVPAVEAISKTIMILRCLGPMKAPRAGVRGRVVCASRFRGPGMATEECWGAPLHQLVHNPETGERPIHIPWPEEPFLEQKTCKFATAIDEASGTSNTNNTHSTSHTSCFC